MIDLAGYIEAPFAEGKMQATPDFLLLHFDEL